MSGDLEWATGQPMTPAIVDEFFMNLLKSIHMLAIVMTSLG
jgi:hypothetical protein